MYYPLEPFKAARIDADRRAILARLHAAQLERAQACADKYAARLTERATTRPAEPSPAP